MPNALRILAGLVCLGAGLAMLVLGDRAAAWAPDPSAAGVVLCLAAGAFLAGPLLRRRRIRGNEFRILPPDRRGRPKFSPLSGRASRGRSLAPPKGHSPKYPWQHGLRSPRREKELLQTH